MKLLSIAELDEAFEKMWTKHGMDRWYARSPADYMPEQIAHFKSLAKMGFIWGYNLGTDRVED